jgi:hypothetical protein
MYVEDIDDVELCWDMIAYLEGLLDNGAINHPQHDQILDDIADLRERIEELEG